MHLSGGIRLGYEVLVVATGATLLPGETEGLTGPGWGERVFTFYDLPGAVGLHDALERFDGGRVVIDVADLPVKCPVAPFEFAFLADWYFQRRGIRDPALIMANGARAEGIEADLFLTFFGLDAITKKRWEHIKPATVGNPGLHLPTLLGGMQGVPGLVTWYMERKMDKLDIPPIPESIEVIADTRAGIYACKASVDPFELAKGDLVDQVGASSPSASSTSTRPEARSSTPEATAAD